MFTSVTNINSPSLPSSLPSTVSGRFISEFNARKESIKQTEKLIACYTEKINNYSQDIANLKKAKGSLKSEIQELTQTKIAADKDRPLKDAAIRVLKVAALVLGYGLLGAASFGILPAVIECSTRIFKKTYYDKTELKIFKKDDEINKIKKEIKDLKKQNPTNVQSLKSKNVELQKAKELHEKGIKIIDTAVEELKESCITLLNTQKDLMERIQKQPDSHIIQGDLADISTKIGNNIKGSTYLKNL